jgi:hypothetical protein
VFFLHSANWLFAECQQNALSKELVYGMFFNNQFAECQQNALSEELVYGMFFNVQMSCCCLTRH